MRRGSEWRAECGAVVKGMWGGGMMGRIGSCSGVVNGWGKVQLWNGLG